MRALLAALTLGALLTGLTACAGAEADTGSSSAGLTPSTSLGFDATTVDGAAFDGASLSGKPTVLWFWAPWCPTCKRQVAGVGALSQQYGDQVNVVGVGSLDDADAIAGFAAKVPGTTTELTDPKGAVWRHFGITEQSTYVVLDANRAVVASGSLSDSKLADVVADLVAAPAAG